MKWSLFFVGLFLPFLLFSQNINHDYVRVKFLRLKQYQGHIPEMFQLWIDEIYEGSDGTIQKESGYMDISSTNHQKRYNMHLTFFGESRVISKVSDTSFLADKGLIKFDIGKLNFVGQEVGTGSIKTPNGYETQYQMFVSISVPIKFQVFDNNQVLIYEEEGVRDTLNYAYPRDFSSVVGVSSFPSEYALKSSYNEKRLLFLSAIKDRYVKNYATHLNNKLKELLGDDKTTLTVDYCSLKGKGKDEKLKLAPFNAQVETFEILVNELKLHCDSLPKNSWHTPYYFDQFQKLGNEIETLLSPQVDALLHNTPEIIYENEAVYAIMKNYMWCLFFTNRFDEVVAFADQMILKSDYSSRWHNMKIMAVWYKPFYEANKEARNWP